MKEVPVQFHNFRKTTTGDNLFTFRVDKLYSKDISELISKDIGTEFMMALTEADTDLPAEKEQRGVREKFWRKMHSLIGDLATLRDQDPAITKKDLKEYLISQKMIEESTTELGIKELAIVCSYLEKEIQEYGN